LSKVDLENNICQVQNELVEEAQASQVLLENIFLVITPSLQIVFGKRKTLRI
jgi:hypothetical protein